MAGRDSKAEKARDNARQRKITSNSSDKAARRNAPKIKRLANSAARQKNKVPLNEALDEIEESADAAKLNHRTKDRHWGSHNAALARSERARERAFLDDPKRNPSNGGRRLWITAGRPDASETE